MNVLSEFDVKTHGAEPASPWQGPGPQELTSPSGVRRTIEPFGTHTLHCDEAQVPAVAPLAVTLTEPEIPTR